MDADQVIEVLRALSREGVRFKIVGAVALNLLGLLYRMKKDTVRLQDRADAERLKRHFGFEG